MLFSDLTVKRLQHLHNYLKTHQHGAVDPVCLLMHLERLLHCEKNLVYSMKKLMLSNNTHNFQSGDPFTEYLTAGMKSALLQSNRFQLSKNSITVELLSMFQDNDVFNLRGPTKIFDLLAVWTLVSHLVSFILFYLIFLCSFGKAGACTFFYKSIVNFLALNCDILVLTKTSGFWVLKGITASLFPKL